MVVDLAPEEQLELTQAAHDLKLSEAEVARQALQRFLASRLESYRQAVQDGDDTFTNDHTSQDFAE
jgi:hypothetical protein